ncbi:hypothetical protein LJR034_007664 [Caballeronia sp. LjRoot34]|uniref:hypothetical protein n=1 Tax=Caballeronia sp. LjRoot34 TaxID=3342325 RepID=UPI003ECD3744
MLKYLCANTAERTFANGAAVINEALHRQAHISTSSDDTRLDRLVQRLLDLDEDDAMELEALGGVPMALGSRSPASFNNVLQQVIRQLQLTKLFCPSQEGEFHRSIYPAAYNERTGEHHPEEMARWRAEFRGMAPEQQMMTSTIIWLYQSGPDSTWLRRVPCTWRAGEAIQYMSDAGCLSLWLNLIARYPGW